MPQIYPQNNPIGTIFTTISQGKTHIAADDHYIGSVDSYNNCLTQLCAWILGRSITVNFDGKTRSVNQQSYQQLLQSLANQNTRIMHVSERRIFRKVAEAGTLPKWNIKMRDALSDGDRQGLFHRLAEAISRGHTTKALQMIGKGAALDIPYYERDGMGPSFYADTDGLSSTRRYKFGVFKATPLMQASLKGHQAVVERLKAAGANTAVSGQQYTFERAIVDVRQDLDFVLQPTVHIRNRHHRQTRIDYHPRLRERTTVVTQDSRTDEKNYYFNQGADVYRT